MTDNIYRNQRTATAGAFIAGVFGMMVSVVTGNDPYSGFVYGALIGLLLWILFGVISDD
jgi:ABC-type uncharacterized transport system permease subunit